MPFTLTWTAPNGSDKITVATAGEAIKEYEERVEKVVMMVIKDNHGRKLTPDHLYELDAIAKDDGEA
ncbi:hypothetical protein [Novosphingobium sp.]|uniref:hypothetical protein n=1 Tax=Novosphingobium sp. TaxID=1874826 RepID=UPI002FDD3549